MHNTLKFEEFKICVKAYYEKYGFLCMPMTGKRPILLTDEIKYCDSALIVPENTPRLSSEILQKPDWLYNICQIADRYSQCLTGIACDCTLSNVIGLDFDDKKFFRHWHRTYKIACPISSTGNGFHAFIRSTQKLKRVLMTDYYDIQAWRFMVLPPSLYYVISKDRKGFCWERGKKDRYNWVVETELPTVNLKDIGLIPSWFLEESQEEVVYNTRKDNLLL